MADQDKERDMPRKKKYDYSGRPLKDPIQKVARPIRANVTIPVLEAIEEVEKELGVSLSDFLRLATFRLLDQQGKIYPDLIDDPTWDGLKQRGLV